MRDGIYNTDAMKNASRTGAQVTLRLTLLSYCDDLKARDLGTHDGIKYGLVYSVRFVVDHVDWIEDYVVVDQEHVVVVVVVVCRMVRVVEPGGCGLVGQIEHISALQQIVPDRIWTLCCSGC